ncbi:hypothetical protein HC024_17795 [Methylococcaceae bacterium WWC4]|nr:hypothetical protein [Methylococcaceae bacterium WWC4]
MNAEPYQASKKRLLLSWYIDFLFFMTLWELLAYYLGLGASIPFWVSYLLFVVMRAISRKFIGSIGYLFLGIDNETKLVNKNIYDGENWLTIVLGVLLILEGTKRLVRWTQVFVSQPIFGFIPDDTTQIIIHVLLGGSSILAGYWFLRLNIKGFYLAVSVAIVNIASDALSWSLWDPIVEKMVIARREFQGLPVRDGEIEFMQSLFPESMLLAATLAVIAMLFTYKRFANT